MRKKALNSQWFKGLSTEEKDKLEGLIRNSNTLLTRLTDVVKGKQVKTIFKTDYDCPSWSHRQADINGYNRALQDVLSLIDLTGDK